MNQPHGVCIVLRINITIFYLRNAFFINEILHTQHLTACTVQIF